MTQGSKTKEKTKLVDYMVPSAAVRRARVSVEGLGQSLREVLGQMRQTLPSRSSVPAAGLADVSDPRERFRVLYERNGWTAHELGEQHKAVSRAKLIALVGGCFTTVGVLGSMVLLPIWLLLFVVPAAGCALILSLALVFQNALWKTQIELQSLISAKDFASMPDFFSRLLK
jgi:hypothetical protein